MVVKPAKSVRGGRAFAALAVIVSLVFTVQQPAATEESGRPIRWGLSVGVAAQVPIGADTSQTDAAWTEFETGMAIHAEVLTFDFGPHVQLVPFVRAVLVGGIDTDTYEKVMGSTESLAGTPDSHMAQVGFGTRYFPFGDGSWFRPFISAYLSYVTAGVEYQVQDIDASMIPEDFAAMVGPTTETWRHSGVGLTLGLGARADLAVEALGEGYLFTFGLEAQWTKNFWLDLEQNSDRTFDRSLLAPEGMDLDNVSLLLTVGFLK